MNETAVHSLEADRRAKLERLRAELGVNPYGQRTEGLVPLAVARDAFDDAAHEQHRQTSQAHKTDPAVEIVDERPRVKLAGRVVLHRDNGKLQWLTLRDETGDLQVAVSKRDVEDVPFQQAKLADLGDIVVASGAVMKTNTGEVTLWAEDFAIATKSLAAPPEKWSGLADPELRYRRRYVDLYTNPEVMQTFRTRSRIMQAVREFLTDPPAGIGPGFLEVETPMMQPIPGGAAARPFVTHHNALDMTLYLRIAPELYLKRLLVGGMARVFEINRNFRNEGIDRSHNPEFTMLELYQAFGDLYSVMEITERLIHHVATTVCGGELLPFGKYEMSYALPFKRAKYYDLFREHAGFDAADHDKLVDLAGKLGVDAAGKDRDILLNDVWEEVVEPHLVQPTFVIDYPASLCPLTRRKPGEPDIAERFELYVAHMEIANAYTELNDPDVQLANFQAQVGGQDEEEATFRNLDLDFIEALKVGMPPAGGLGVGIDRVVMLMTNQQSIRDVILFPLLRPQTREEK